MNVLVYSGKGTTAESVKHCLESLRLHLSPSYAVVAVNESAILNDPWMSKTSMLVIPGGADLPLCRLFDGEGNKKIKQFVRKGGRYIGFCSGGYYASDRCEFETGTDMEVSGPRELSFFPGMAKGCAFKGFSYESHEGSKCVWLEDFNGKKIPNYYNGGGVFIDAEKYANTEVLARYTNKTELETDDRAAVILCTVGKGLALLTGTHPEFTTSLMRPSADEYAFYDAYNELNVPENERNRKLFLRDCLKKLGLKVNEDVDVCIPQLTPVYLSSLKPETICKLKMDLQEMYVPGTTRYEDCNDTFEFHDEKENDHDYFISDTVVETPASDLDSVVKHVKIIQSLDSLPSHKLTPYFNMSSYFKQLSTLWEKSGSSQIGSIGSTFGYSEVITSTNTLLDKNPGWLQQLPHGFTLTATTQVSGRGRGGNVWVNPKGVMATSVLFKVPVGGPQPTSIVTLQYLCGLALVELIFNYGSLEAGQGIGYEDMPIKLKWPNDIYSMKPEFFNLLDKDSIKAVGTVEADEQTYAKISGALINSQFLDGVFHLVWGVGVNVSNTAPTTSLNLVLEKLNVLRAAKGLPELPPYQHEILLAKMLHTVEQFYSVFQKSGIKPFLPLYYKRWFHSDQTVAVDAGGNGAVRRCKIKGITPDYGLLIVEDLENHQILELQPDGNSFDIFKGLIYKKS